MASDETPNEAPEAPEALPAKPSFPARYARFGPFQIDLQRGEFRRHGERVNLHGKVYQALVILLSCAGEVVTREEMRRLLWPDAPQVNFDANVNTTINKLRQMLGDSPDNPVYVETIPRRGYSFLAKVEFSNSPEPSSVKMPAPMFTPAEPVALIDGTNQQIPYSLPVGLRIATLVLAGMVVGSILALAWVSYARAHKPVKTTQESAMFCEPAADPRICSACG
jgi:DNA-binding winged helix-turn-helix (wHTH) protein